MIGRGEPPAFPGLPGHEPDFGAYVAESSFFELEWQRAYWGPNYGGLLAVKKRYDPDGLFFVHHGVGSEDLSADGFTRVARPEADRTVDDCKFVGIVSRFELSDLELDRPVEKTGLWRTAFGIWMRRRNAPIFG